MTRTPIDAPHAAADFSLSCIVPAYNEEIVIERFVAALGAEVARHTARYELIVVDDGSRDATNAILSALAAVDQRLRVVRFARNFGKDAAITAGLARARGDAVLIIDADFQDPLDMIAPMLAQWRAGIEMVYGVRDERPEETLARRVGVKLFYRLLAIGQRVHVPPFGQDFRLLDRRVVDAINRLPERSRFMKGLYAWVGFQSIGLPYRHRERAAGLSSFSKRRLLRLAATGLTAFSNWPLRIWSWLGLAVACCAVVAGVAVAVQTLLFGNAIQGFTTLVVSVLFFFGVQLFSIGVIGEYLARIYEEVKARPIFLLAEELDASPLRAAHDLPHAQPLRQATATTV